MYSASVIAGVSLSSLLLGSLLLLSVSGLLLSVSATLLPGSFCDTTEMSLPAVPFAESDQPAIDSIIAAAIVIITDFFTLISPFVSSLCYIRMSVNVFMGE